MKLLFQRESFSEALPKNEKHLNQEKEPRLQVGNEQSRLLAVTDIFRQLRAFYCLL
jgi:hypothetical protein